VAGPGLWIVALVGLSPFSSKLAGAQKNDAVQYLPSSAESTKVFNETKPFIGDSIPTSTSYQRTTGITRADRAKIAADTRRIDIDVLGSQSPGPKVTESGDGQAVLVNLEVPALWQRQQGHRRPESDRPRLRLRRSRSGHAPTGVHLFVALGIDCNIFLMTRVREETPRIGTQAGALRALA
jgi:hypothetical protein